MNELKIFENAEFGKIRTVQLNSETYFVGKDVADALGYVDAFGALKKHVDEEDKLVCQIDSAGQRRDATAINESGLYALIFGSKLESAKRFKHWVTSEVLPSLRENNGYFVGQGNMSPEQIMAAGIKVAESIIREKDKQIERMRPKEIFADAVSASHSSILVGELAKILNQNGVEIGQNRLFAYLRDNSYLIKRSGSDWNMPTQRSMELGLFEIKESPRILPNGSVVTDKVPRVTGRGQKYFINKFLKGVSR